MKISEKINRFFHSGKGRWVLTGVFLVMLVGIAAYTEFFPQEAKQPQISADNNQQATPQVDTLQTAGEQSEMQQDGLLLRPNPDTEVAEPPAVEAGAAPSSWLMPLSGEIGRKHGFGYDSTYNDYRFHHGIDIMAEPGSPVYAAATGTVTLARQDPYWGGVVMLEHGGEWQSIYRCLEPAVSIGTEIAAGELLGYILESSTNEAGQEAHLHFELYLVGDEMDPAEWL